MNTNAVVARNSLEAALRDPGRRMEIENAMPFDDPKTVRAAMQQLIDFARMQEGLLARCDDKSKFECCLVAARLGLQLNTPAHHVAAVPFKRKDGTYCATPIIEYRGLVALFKRYANVKAVRTELVRQNDVYKRNAETFVHEWDPFLSEHERGKAIGAYAMVELHDGTKLWETMSVEQIEHIRAKSRAANDGPWVTDWPQMARKTPLRRLANMLDWSPKGAELLQVADRTEFSYDDSTPVEVVGPVKRAPKGSQATLDVLMGVQPGPVESIDPDTGEVIELPPKAEEEEVEPPKPDACALHLVEAQAVCKQYGLPIWQSLTDARKRILKERMRELGMTEGRAFWAHVRQVLAHLTPDYYANWKEQVSLDVLLRVPKRGNPDHFTKLAEGPAPARVESIRTEGAPPVSSALLDLMGGE